MSAIRVAVVVPTRNRAELAIRAVLSVLRQQTPDVQILVSDNSTLPEETSKLRDGLAGLGVSVVAPPTDLSMTAHWNWAIEHAQDRLAPTHVTFLTDRMVFKRSVLPMLLGYVKQMPTFVLSYNHDRVQDADRPIYVDLQRSSWRLFRISSQVFLDEVASGKPWQWVTPRMLNCVVPVTLLEEVRALTGSIFGSVAPDFYFGYKVAALVDSFYALDAPLLVHYGLGRSNGYSQQTGKMSPDADDFRRHVENPQMESPFPTVETISNSMFHEYAVVARETACKKFRALDPLVVAQTLRKDAESLVPGDHRRGVLRALATSPPTSRPTPLSRAGVQRIGLAIRYRSRGTVRRVVSVVAAESLPAAVRGKAIILPFLGFSTAEAAVEAAARTSMVRPRLRPLMGAIDGAGAPPT